MPTSEGLRKLRSILAQLYSDKASAIRVVEDVGIPIAAVPLHERAVDTWHEILKEVQKHDRLALLLEIVGEEYGANPKFRAVSQSLRAQPDSLPQPTPTVPDVAGWQLVHPYPMPPHFSGRVRERRLLSEWLEADRDHPLLQVRALGGFGKSALTWHWLTHDVDPARWPRILWWSFYESDSNFENFLLTTLTYLDSASAHLADPRKAVEELLRYLARPGILLILDGFERALRAYSSLAAAYQGDDPAADRAHYTSHSALESISPYADYFLRCLAILPGLHSKVLMTTRLTPYSLTGHGGLLLKGCRELELPTLHPADAVALFRSLGVRGNRSEIENACVVYGFHPLSLRLLAGLVLKDLQQPGDIGVSRRLDLTGDLVQRQHHVLAQAYTSLSSSCRQLLSILACFRSPVVYEVLKAISTTSLSPSPDLVERNGELVDGSVIPAIQSVDFDNNFHDLLERGLVQRDERSGRFDLHPIVRRYAYDILGGQQRRTAHHQLRSYFVTIEVPEQVHTLDELTPLVELYHHTVRVGYYDQAFALFRARLHAALFYQFGDYQLQIELLRALFPIDEVQLPRLKREVDQAWTLNALANNYSLSGQPYRAVPLFELACATATRQEHKNNLAIGLGNLAQTAQLPIGALRAAEANLRRRIDLCREIGDARNERIGHKELGRLLSYRGMWEEAASELATAFVMDKEQNHIQGQGLTAAYQALLALLMVRAASQGSEGSSVQAMLSFAHRALDMADQTTHTQFSYARDYVRAYRLLGAAQHVNGDLDAAEHHLSEALTRCRTINAVEAEADILIDLARLRRDQGQADAALALVNEALLITERCGYVLQGADAHLLLAELALAAGNVAQASIGAQKARDLAFCDGPPYTYYVAYTKAEAFLTRLG